LFNNAPDLLEEFKQFLPENGSAGGLGFGSFMQAAASGQPTIPDKAPVKKGSRDVKDAPPAKKRRGAGDGKAPARVSWVLC
jgi:paired amphipathic helix protein Sin3a